MTLDTVLDVLIAVLLLLGAFFCLAAGIGIIRFPDTLSRVHAGTKPQVVGLACILAAVILSTRNWSAIAIMVLILLFQMLTTPAAAHMIGRAAYRQGQHESEELFVDELEQAVELANRDLESNTDPESNRDPESNTDGEGSAG